MTQQEQTLPCPLYKACNMGIQAKGRAAEVRRCISVYFKYTVYSIILVAIAAPALSSMHSLQQEQQGKGRARAGISAGEGVGQVMNRDLWVVCHHVLAQDTTGTDLALSSIQSLKQEQQGKDRARAGINAGAGLRRGINRDLWVVCHLVLAQDTTGADLALSSTHSLQW